MVMWAIKQFIGAGKIMKVYNDSFLNREPEDPIRRLDLC